MNHLRLKRSVLCNIKSYDLCLTTSFETKHGISGHLFEMIEYFYHFKFHKNLNVCILISDGTTEYEYFTAIESKYKFTTEELGIFKNNTIFKFQPMTIIGNNIIFVDGSLRMKNCEILCKQKIFLRCSEDDYLDKADLILQDYELYDKLNNSKNYKKKLLFSKFKEINKSVEDTGMFYATSNTRILTKENLEELTEKHKFSKYIILSNIDLDVPENVEVLKVPLPNLWETFSTYIYTGLTNPNKIDCSPRFIAECFHYKKDVIYNSYRVHKGMEIRRNDILTGVNIELKENDEITKLFTIL